MTRLTSCGVIISDGHSLLLGHATRSPRWDIPKGIAEPGETLPQAAVRELFEETGLRVTEAQLKSLGVHVYLRNKDLAVFVWTPGSLPAPESLVCHSTFTLPGGAEVPEFDRFGVFPWAEASAKVGRNLARVLAQVRDQVMAS